MMSSWILRAAVMATCVVASAADLFAQLPQTRLTSLFPPGTQRGTTTEITITGGTDLDEVDGLIFSHAGLKAVQKLDAQGQPVSNTFIVSADVMVPAGLYDARVRGLFGISNPRAFRIDTLPEATEVEPNNTPDQATPVTLNTVINARSNAATDVDFFRVPVDAGQTVVVRAEAARLDSTMQPQLEILAPSGHRIGEARRIFSQDAAVVFTAETAGEYLIRVTDIVYAGGNEYVYRLSVDTRPLIDAIVPAVVSTTQPTEVMLLGRHVPGGQPSSFLIDGQILQQKTHTLHPNPDSESATGIASFAASGDAVLTSQVDGNLLTVTHSDSPPVVEDTAADVQTVTVPVEIDGRFEKPADEDEYRFTATKGDNLVIEVYSDRQGSIADPLLMVESVVSGADGVETFARLATEDDNKQNPGGADLPTLSGDPMFALTVPEDGLYRIRLQDRYAQSRGDARLSYRLSIRKPTPDFRLVVFDAFPSADGKAPATSGAVSLRKGGSYSLTVFAYRQDGHNEAIRLQAADLPEGIQCPETRIGAGQTSATLVFTASADVAEQVSRIRITGTAGPEGQQLTHTAKIATLIHDAINGMPRTARLSDSLVLGVMKDEQPFSLEIDPLIVDLSQDQQLLIPVRLHRRGGFDRKVDITFLGVPANVDAPGFAIEPGQDSAVARIFAKENAAVTSASMVLSGTASVPYRRNPWQAERAQQQVQQAEAMLSQKQQAAAESQTAFQAAQKVVTDAGENIAALMKTIAQITEMQRALREQFTKSLTDYKAAMDQLTLAKTKLVAVQSARDASAEDFDAAVQASQEAATAAQTAASHLSTLTAKAEELSAALVQTKSDEATKTAERAAAEAALPQLKATADAAQAAVTAAMQLVEQAQAQKTAADEAFKKADEAAKPKDVPARAVSVPIALTLLAAPGKLAAAVPDAGAVKRGATAEAKVTLTRKNGFAGPMSVTLVLPPGVQGVTSNTAEIAADKTETTLAITAAADAAVADISHAVIRATGDFQNRRASIDIPVPLKVTE